MTSLSGPREESPGRRGMLLLLVLSMLTLFILMGTLALVMATRSRESARAFADATGGGNGSPIIAESMADEALLMLIRGSKDPAVNALLGDDNLLKDMYGTQGNGRFVDEPYDSFDLDNRFLTHVILDPNGRVSSVPRPAFGARADECKVDNDGDGVADSVWLSGLLQPLTLANGNHLDFRVAYLVLDLDGRINVNTHGRRPEDQSSASGGPADINASQLFTSEVWNLLMAGTGGQLLSGSVSAGDQWRPVPPVSSPVDGRFGGFQGANNAKGELEYTYGVRLDLEAPRPSALSAAAGQNPFTPGELERVLRQFDSDASTLPPRLAAILHDQAERARMRITTDSWETPGDRYDIKWEADNSGVNDEKAAWAELWPRVVAAGASEADAKQWVANLLDFRDQDKAVTNFDGGIKGVEPSKLNPPIPGQWDDGRFRSYGDLLAIPKGTESEINQKMADGEPLVSLVKNYPKILESVAVPFFLSTLAVDPHREPGRVNVNTCDTKVWEILLGDDDPNPFALSAAGTGTPAKATVDMLLTVPLIFPDATHDVRQINHAVANRLANVATVRSHVFAVWITIEVKDSDNPDQPTYHRLFAIVDRSIPAEFTAATEGQNTNVRNIIRLQRFLN
ncbi:hypothetical protein [Phenylobacterium sp.]|uniref:hypothetical protein n=1 Tax=Phenylobacterium sp. TaxID=1871053 RepID=UPI0037CB1DDB